MIYKRYKWIILQQKPKDGGDVMNVNSITSISRISYLTYKTGQSNRTFASISNKLNNIKSTTDTSINSSRFSSSERLDLLKKVLTNRSSKQKITQDSLLNIFA